MFQRATAPSADRIRPRSVPVRRAVLGGLMVLTLVAAGCGDDAQDTADSIQDSVGSAANTALARTQAETLRATIKAKGDGNADKYLSVTMLTEAIKDLPGNTKVNGIADTNGDGKDDDGKMEVVVNDATVCVSITGTNTEVDDGAC
jgi:hypothetical protein